jgi:hypothetical protein
MAGINGEIILQAIKNSLRSDQVTDQVKKLIEILINGENDT